MHHTNGFLENSGPEDGTPQSAQTRDRTLLRPSSRPEYSELTEKSMSLRERIYGTDKSSDTDMRHYVRKPRHCDNCPEVFSSKVALRNHRFSKHSY